MKKTIIIRNTGIKQQAISYVMNLPVSEQNPIALTIGELTRNLEQNAKFHAICHDLAQAGAEWAGKPRNADEWKVLLVSGHAIATKLGAEIVPGLEGEFVNLRESTAKMSKARASSLIEYSIAFCVANQVGDQHRAAA